MPRSHTDAMMGRSTVHIIGDDDDDDDDNNSISWTTNWTTPFTSFSATGAEPAPNVKKKSAEPPSVGWRCALLCVYYLHAQVDRGPFSQPAALLSLLQPTHSSSSSSSYHRRRLLRSHTHARSRGRRELAVTQPAREREGARTARTCGKANGALEDVGGLRKQHPVCDDNRCLLRY